MQQLREYIEEVANSARVADAVDIVVVAVIVYFAITWFRRSHSRLVMSGLGILAVLYLAAGLLEMHLTLALFQAGLTVAVVALVVIFQDEIRRGFERVALASRFQKESVPAALDATVDTVVEAAATFANDKTGALIVFAGKEPLDRHLKRGIALDGQVSLPLLQSIFDSSSPGHDGALVIENGRVTRFGVHLPLAAEARDERSGTRHSAALGLSERCDALVIVVSEERGVISVAEDGRLQPLKSGAALRQRIAKFKARVAPKSSKDHVVPLLTGNLAIKLLSLVIAVAAWAVAYNYQTETVTGSLRAAVLFENVPAGNIVREHTPADVVVAVSGPKSKIERLESESVSALVDASRAKEGLNRQQVTDAEIALPRGVVVRDVQPSVVRYTVERIVDVNVPVKANTSGQLKKGLWLKQVRVTPPRVKVRLPRSRASLRHVNTEVVLLDGFEQSGKVTRGLLLPKGIELSPGQPKQVTVEVVLGGSVP